MGDSTTPIGDDLDLLIQAVEQLVPGHTERVGFQFIQRRLHVAYPAARRLWDLMDHYGIIGPPPPPGGEGMFFLIGEDEIPATIAALRRTAANQNGGDHA